jgi:hypothetical protein
VCTRLQELLAEQAAVASMWVPYQRLNCADLRKAEESVRPGYERSALVRAGSRENPAGK